MCVQTELRPPKNCIEVPTSSLYSCDLIWKQSLCKEVIKLRGRPGRSVVKNPPANAGGAGLILG